LEEGKVNGITHTGIKMEEVDEVSRGKETESAQSSGMEAARAPTVIQTRR